MARDTLITWILRISFALMALALGTTALRYGNPISSTVFIDWDLDEVTSNRLTALWAWLLIACGISGLHPRAWLMHLATTALMILLVSASIVQAEISPHLIPFSSATRALAPIALAVLLARPDLRDRATWILRLCAAGTFAGHGAQALHHDSYFADLIFAASQTVFGLEIDQGTVEVALSIIGVSDLLLAVLCMTGRLRWPLILMACWGLITALSRMVHAGFEGWPLTAERIPNATVPLAAFLLGRASKDHSTSP